MEERGGVGSARDSDHHSRPVSQNGVTATLAEDSLNDVAPGHGLSIGGEARRAG
jgi:hypothetical protein